MNCVSPKSEKLIVSEYPDSNTFTNPEENNKILCMPIESKYKDRICDIEVRRKEIDLEHQNRLYEIEERQKQNEVDYKNALNNIEIQNKQEDIDFKKISNTLNIIHKLIQLLYKGLMIIFFLIFIILFVITFVSLLLNGFTFNFFSIVTTTGSLISLTATIIFNKKYKFDNIHRMKRKSNKLYE